MRSLITSRECLQMGYELETALKMIMLSNMGRNKKVKVMSRMSMRMKRRKRMRRMRKVRTMKRMERTRSTIFMAAVILKIDSDLQKQGMSR